ncbi:ABC transporter permease [Porcipelethomonas sp.]|uniref:ABC transporter permease n=1 Tax=Porcipelethomonas sp. TaxID=2981675 RepID=UPI003EF570E6
MYLRILKKDLKRKKTMNVILLIFITMAAMFMASSVNNIITVVSGLDNYFEKAGMTDYYIIANSTDETNNIKSVLEEEKSVSEIKSEKFLCGYSDNFTDEKGEKISDFSNMAIIMSISEAKLNYFDSKDNVIKNVPEGKVYLSGPLAKDISKEVGDKICISFGNTTLDLEYAGIAKDAFLGSDMMSNPRCILNDKDYRKLYSYENISEGLFGEAYYVNSSDISSLEKTMANAENILFSGTKSTIKMTYVMNMIVAGLLLIVSVCLILVSFVVLKFTINFTISEEFREIGVMKALGIRNDYIRMLYLVKYFSISVVGAFIGYFANIPFGKMLLSDVSENMVLSNDNSMLTGILCAIAVVFVIMLFCWNCTRKIKKLSPIDAVRNGQTGERFSRKNFLNLGKSRLNSTVFMAVNDVVSSPKQFSVITVVFTICMLLVMILANTANTLNSEKLLFLFGTQKSDLYYTNTSRIIEVIGKSKTFEEVFDDIETILAENNMPGEVTIERMFILPVTKGNKKVNTTFQQCKSTKASDYTYSEGTAPKYENEIALTKQLAEKLGAEIGDEVQIGIDGEEKTYIVTAFFQSMCQLGESGRLHESVSIPDYEISSAFSFQIDFDDNPDKAEIEIRKEKLKEIFDTEKVFNTEEFVKDSTGAADIVSNVKNMVLVLSLIITAMIGILMERSFITKEKSEIALMKATGIKSRSVIMIHILRFAVAGIIAAVISLLVNIPLTKLCIDPVFSMMGAINGVEYEIRPLEIFVIYPVFITAAILLGTFFTALYTKTIKSSDISNIE